MILIAAAIGFSWWAMQHDFIDQTSGPVTREKALKHCPIPLPADARNIQYASFTSGLQCGEMFVRFEAPVPECRAFAQSVFAKRAEKGRDYSVPEFRSTSYAGAVMSEQHLKTDWFDTDRDAKWVVAGAGHGWQPKIWIDEERGIFYYYVTD